VPAGRIFASVILRREMKFIETNPSAGRFLFASRWTLFVSLMICEFTALVGAL
jgi:hypothetical protein